MRLDKFICDMLGLTRTEAKNVIKKGNITVNNSVCKDSSIHINPEKDDILYNNKQIAYKSNKYYLLNKPSGVITATHDDNDKTVIDLVAPEIRKNLIPVGRLDKDTEGLLLLTDDGELSHKLLSPKSHVDKGYYCELEKNVTKEDLDSLAQGINIGDDTPTLPAKVEIIDSQTVLLYICEGRYHQVKRMFQALCNKVTFLKRISFGPLNLEDYNLNPGEYIELTEEQVKSLKEYKYDKRFI